MRETLEVVLPEEHVCIFHYFRIPYGVCADKSIVKSAIRQRGQGAEPMWRKYLATCRNLSVASVGPSHRLPHQQRKSGSAVEIKEDVQADLSLRLRRIEGQIRGIQAMIEESRDCKDVVTQIAAASKALDQVGFKMLASGLSSCLENPKKSAKQGYSVAEVEKLFLKLA